MTLSNVCFDIGKVLYYFSLDNTVDKLSQIKSRNKKLFKSKDTCLSWLKEIQPRMDIGFYSFEECLKILHPKISDEALNEAMDVWIDAITPCQEMIDLVKELISKKVKVALLTNMGPEHASIIENNDDLKDCIIQYSYVIGARKPTSLYFQTFLNSNPEFCDSYYFDDNEDNIRAGNDYFIPGLFSLEMFDSGAEAAEEIRNLLYQDGQ